MTDPDGLLVLLLAPLPVAAMAAVVVWERRPRRRARRPYAAAPLAASGDTAVERNRA